MWVRHLVGLVEGIVLRDTAGRVARYLVEMGDGNRMMRLPGRKLDVASHLNMTSESFSRTLRLLRKEHLIAEQGDHELVILNPKGLQAVAEGLFPEV